MTVLRNLMKKKSCQQGFTLLELMTAVVLMGIVTMTGFPSLMLVLNEQKLTTQVNDMVASLNLARSVSIKRRHVVTIRKITNWNNGWQIFVDEDGDGTLDGGEIVLKTYPATAVGSGTMTTSLGFADFIRYYPNGRADAAGEFIFCPPAGVDSSRKIDIVGSGRMRTVKGNYAANCP